MYICIYTYIYIEREIGIYCVLCVYCMYHALYVLCIIYIWEMGDWTVGCDSLGYPGNP